MSNVCIVDIFMSCQVSSKKTL